MFQFKTLKFSLLLILLSLFTAACAQGGMAEPAASREEGVVGVIEQESAAAGEADFDDGSFDTVAQTAPQEPLPDTQAGTSTQIQERLIIRTAELSLVVADTEESIAAVTGITNGRGGWVVSSSTYQSGQAMRGNMTIRIPAEDFDAVLTQIKESAVEVTRESVSGQDVTEEYVDLSARLDNLEATADRVRSFLNDTRTVEEALQVNNELSRLEGEIEALKGRLQYLSQSAAFSTIIIDFTPDVLNQPIEVAGWRPQGIARDAIEALVETLQVVASIGIWLVLYILPLLLVIGLPLYFLIRWFIRRRKARRSAAVTAE